MSDSAASSKATPSARRISASRAAIVTCRQQLQAELQAARQHRHGDLLRLGRGQHEFHMLGRLLERLQHRVERRPRQHVHLVDEVDLVPADGRRVARVIEDLAHVVDAGVRCRVELEQVDEAPGIDVDTGRADSARRRRHAFDAVEALGKDARDGRLAHAARSGEQIGMVQPAALERVGQRAHDMLLAREFGKRFRSPLAGEGLIAHRV